MAAQMGRNDLTEARCNMAERGDRAIIDVLKAQPDGFLEYPRALNYTALLHRTGLPEDEFRSGLARLVRSKQILPLARRVYQLPDRCMVPGYTSLPLRANNMQIAELHADETGRKLALSVAEAEARCGLAVQPSGEVYQRLALEGIKAPITIAGVSFEPAPDLVWRVSWDTASLIQGIRSHIDSTSAARIAELGQEWGRRHRPPAADNLRRDINLLPDPYQVAAGAAISILEAGDAVRIARRKAPAGFTAPADGDRVATLERWRVILWTNENGCRTEHLAAISMTGHPRLSGIGLSRSTELNWIDAELGYAETLNTLYRLVGLGAWYPEAV